MPKEGEPDPVGLKLDQFTSGIATFDAAIADQGLNPNLGGRPMEIVLLTDDADKEYARLTAGGAPSPSLPHDFLGFFLVAWVSDPDGNPIQAVQRCEAGSRVQHRMRAVEW